MSRLLELIGFALSGCLIGAAWLFPGHWEGLLLTWVAVAIFAFLLFGSQQVRLGSYVAGITTHAVGFYWLSDTIVFFGGFPRWLGLSFQTIFCLFAALQFLLLGFLFQKFERTILKRWELSLPAAWFLSEGLFPRMFPWSLAHTQIEWTAFSGLAEALSIEFLSALLVWGVVVCLKKFFFSEPSWAPFVSAAVVFVLVLAFGAFRQQQVLTEMSALSPIRVGLIQGNLEARQKRDVKYFQSNLQTYRALSAEAVAEGAELLLWPETVVNAWIPEDLSSLAGTRFDAYPEREAAVLFGSLGFRPRSREEQQKIIDGAWGAVSPQFRKALEHYRFNSSFGLDRAGRVIGVYHKRVLMPFGEYLPYGRVFPYLQTLSPYSGDLDRGDRLDPIEFTFGGDRKAAVMPLVCYEDLVTPLALEAVGRGAEVFVNLTNDAWYGDTAAPYQHHLIAAWRAIETRRFLLRVTNTGYTAIVNPLGQTREGLPIFEEGKLVSDVKMLSSKTMLVCWGRWPFWVLSSILFSLLIVPRTAQKELDQKD